MLSRYKDGKYPENMEKFVISNSSPLEADVSFCFLNDNKADTFLLDPPTTLLKPAQQQVECQTPFSFFLQDSKFKFHLNFNFHKN